MKIKSRHTKTAAIATALMGLFLYGTAQAQEYDFRWNGSGGTAYWERSDSTGWLLYSGASANAYPNAAGVYAYVSKTTPLGASQTINLTNSIMIGRLDIGNVTNSGTTRNYTIADGTGTGGGYLNFTSYAGGNAQINELAGILMGDKITAAVKLSASLDISNASNLTISLAGGVSSLTAGEKTVTLKTGKAYISSLDDGAATISVVNNGGLLTIGNIGYTGNTYIGSTSTITYNQTTTLSYNGIISGAGSLIKEGGGGLTLSAHNTYTGNTTMRAGSLFLSSNTSLGNGGKLIFENTGWAQTLFTASTTFTHNIELNNSSAALIGVDEGLTATLTGNITGTGSAGMQKRFGGTLVLDGSASFSGSVTVGAGTLIINGNASNATGYMIVVSTASLGGSGSYGGAAQLNGTITPDGTLSMGTVTLSAYSHLQIGLDKVGGIAVSDCLSATSVNIGSTGADLALSVDSGASAITAGDIFYIIVNDGTDSIVGQFYSLNGTATDLSEGATITYGDATLKITYQGDSASHSFTGGNDVALQVIAIPEPAIAAALLGLMGLALVVRRRR